MKLDLFPTLALAGVLALLTPAAAFAQAATTDNPAKTEAVAKMNQAAAGSFTTADKKLINLVARSDKTEISMAKIALSKTGNAEIKRYAQMMINDHGKTTLQLKPIATAAGMVKPEIKARDKATAARIEALSGSKFDLAYLQANVQSHQETATKLKAQAPGVTNPDLKSFAAATLPVVEHHVMMAREMVAKMGGATAKKAGM